MKYRLTTNLYIESFKSDKEVLDELNKITNCNLYFQSEDEDKNIVWDCIVLGFYITVTKYGNDNLKNWYSFKFGQVLNMIPDQYNSVLNLNFHFKNLFSQLNFENILTLEEFNAEILKRNSKF